MRALLFIALPALAAVGTIPFHVGEKPVISVRPGMVWTYRQTKGTRSELVLLRSKDGTGQKVDRSGPNGRTESMWIVRGLGIVKWKTGGRLLELVRMEEPS